MQSEALARAATMPGALGSGGVPSPGNVNSTHPLAAAYHWLRGCCEPSYLLMGCILLAILILQVRQNQPVF